MPAIIIVPGSAFSSRSIPALLARCDVYEFAGETVFQRGAGVVTMPTTSGMYDGGRYPDLVAFLNGYGSQLGQSMSEALNADWTANGGVPATWEVGIDGDDRIFVRVLTSEIASFTVQSNASYPWGFASGATPSTTAASYQVVTAASSWERGNLDLWNAGQTFTVNDGLTLGGLYNVDVTVHSLPVALRAYSDGADGVYPTDSLEQIDNNANDNVFRRIRWGIDTTGRVWTSYPSSILPVGWPAGSVSARFRRMLGFAGDESPVLLGSRYLLTATYRTPLVLVVERGLTRHSRILRSIDGVVELSDGRARGRHVGHSITHELEFTVRGQSAAENDEGQVIAAWAPYVGRGQPCTLDFTWGDSRRARLLETMSDGYDTPAYTTGYTTEPLCGRVVARVAESSTSTVGVRLSGARVRSEPISMTLVEEP
jgi:hypothetical protein